MRKYNIEISRETGTIRVVLTDSLSSSPTFVHEVNKQRCRGWKKGGLKGTSRTTVITKTPGNRIRFKHETEWKKILQEWERNRSKNRCSFWLHNDDSSVWEVQNRMKKINKNFEYSLRIFSESSPVREDMRSSSSECNFDDFSSIGKKEIEIFVEHDEAFIHLLVNEINFSLPHFGVALSIVNTAFPKLIYEISSKFPMSFS